MLSTVPLYNCSLATLLDAYQLTMAQLYWLMGLADVPAVFNLTFRRNPFKGGYALAGGLQAAIDLIRGFRFVQDDIDHLADLRGNDNRPIFRQDFLEYLLTLRLRCRIDAIPEGTAVFPNEPLVRVMGPLLQGQLLESPLLTLVNSQTLWTTLAARIVQAAQGRPVIEGGMRRAQGIDGALSAARCAYLGGFAATSNVLAARLFGIPLKGTVAHSFVMVQESELDAFQAMAEHMPNNCVFLADTFNTLEGVRHAVQVGQTLRHHGHEMIGVRLDSGDLAFLSQEARKILNQGGFEKAIIVASNDLDERLIASLLAQGARIDSFLVGTHYITAYGQPALGGVYKLAAVFKNGCWTPKVKLSEQRIKTSVPGVQQVRRYLGPDGSFIADQIFDVTDPDGPGEWTVNPEDELSRKRIPGTPRFCDLLTPIFDESGALVYRPPHIAEIRARVKDQLSQLHPGILRLDNPHSYPAGLSLHLHELRSRLVLGARGEA